MPEGEALSVQQFAELLRGQEHINAEVAALRREFETYRNEHRLEHKADSDLSRRRYEESQTRADKRHDDFIEAFHKHEVEDAEKFAEMEGTVKSRSQIGAIIGALMAAAMTALGTRGEMTR